MTTLSSIEKRVTELEEKSGEDRTLIFVDYEGASVEDSTRHIYNQCKKCCDPDILESALDEATKRNQAKEDHEDIVVITKEVILNVVQRLKEQGIEVSL